MKSLMLMALAHRCSNLGYFMRGMVFATKRLSWDFVLTSLK